jgi:hypothetical protein
MLLAGNADADICSKSKSRVDNLLNYFNGATTGYDLRLSKEELALFRSKFKVLRPELGENYVIVLFKNGDLGFGHADPITRHYMIVDFTNERLFTESTDVIAILAKGEFIYDTNGKLYRANDKSSLGFISKDYLTAEEKKWFDIAKYASSQNGKDFITANFDKTMISDDYRFLEYKDYPSSLSEVLDKFSDLRHGNGNQINQLIAVMTTIVSYRGLQKQIALGFRK